MTSDARVIENYEKLSALTRELLDAAVRGEWEQLAEIQQKRTALGETMASIDAITNLGESASRRKDELIEQVLADEANIRERVKARMGQMEAELKEGRQELRLLREYRRHAV